MRPVSAKNVVLALVRFSSAALKESWQPSRLDLGTFIPGSTESAFSLESTGVEGLGGAVLGGRKDVTSCSASSSSAWVRKADIG